MHSPLNAVFINLPVKIADFFVYNWNLLCVCVCVLQID